MYTGMLRMNKYCSQKFVELEIHVQCRIFCQNKGEAKFCSYKKILTRYVHVHVHYVDLISGQAYLIYIILMQVLCLNYLLPLL